MSTKVHRVTLIVIDHDDIGSDEVKSVIENQKYPNWCIRPSVTQVETIDIGEWADEHPLNHRDTDSNAYFEAALQEK